jgi:hypothetical protein
VRRPTGLRLAHSLLTRSQTRQRCIARLDAGSHRPILEHRRLRDSRLLILIAYGPEPKRGIPLATANCEASANAFLSCPRPAAAVSLSKITTFHPACFGGSACRPSSAARSSSCSVQGDVSPYQWCFAEFMVSDGFVRKPHPRTPWSHRREWDGPAALPPLTALRVLGGLVRAGAPPCLAGPPFAQPPPKRDLVGLRLGLADLLLMRSR